MTDPNMVDFYGRIARIQTARSKGYGFEAAGALGRSYYFRPTRKRRAIFAPLMMIVVCSLGLKGLIHSRIGADIYNARVELLISGKGFERLGGYLMMADPATIFVSERISRLRF